MWNGEDRFENGYRLDEDIRRGAGLRGVPSSRSSPRSHLRPQDRGGWKMHRSRSDFISLGLVIALAAGIASVQAQQPTGPGGPGGRQGRQGGPGGGPGGPGGFGFGGPGARGGELSLVNDP